MAVSWVWPEWPAVDKYFAERLDVLLDWNDGDMGLVVVGTESAPNLVGVLLFAESVSVIACLWPRNGNEEVVPGGIALMELC